MKKIYMMLIFCMSFLFSGSMFASQSQANDQSVKMIKVGGDDSSMTPMVGSTNGTEDDDKKVDGTDDSGDDMDKGDMSSDDMDKDGTMTDDSDDSDKQS